MRREELAPPFDRSKPREFPQYFDDLEALFTRANVTDDAEKKKWVLRYLDFETEQLWEALPEFDNTLSTYDNFKYAILGFYPEAYGDFIYSINDLEALITDYQQQEILSLEELLEFHRRFLTISNWLIKKRQLTKLEQQRAYIRSFEPAIFNSINKRLQLKNPDHHPGVPYPIEDVLNAAHFIIMTMQAHYSAPQATPPCTSNAHTTGEAHPRFLLAEVKQPFIKPVKALPKSSVKPQHIYSNIAPTATKAMPLATYSNAKYSEQDRIAALEAELASLRASMPQPVTNAFNSQQSYLTEDNAKSDMNKTELLRQHQDPVAFIIPAIQAPNEIFCTQILPCQSLSTKVAIELAPTSTTLVSPTERTIYAPIAPKPSNKITAPNHIALTSISPLTSPFQSTISPQNGNPLQALTMSSSPSSDHISTTTPSTLSNSTQTTTCNLQSIDLTPHVAPTTSAPAALICSSDKVVTQSAVQAKSSSNNSTPSNSHIPTSRPLNTQIQVTALHARAAVWKPPDKLKTIKRIQSALLTAYTTLTSRQASIPSLTHYMASHRPLYNNFNAKSFLQAKYNQIRSTPSRCKLSTLTSARLCRLTQHLQQTQPTSHVLCHLLKFSKI